MTRIPSRLAALALASLAAGCSHSPPTTMLTLDALPPPHGPRGDYRGPPIAVPAVHIPAALDHADYVSQPTASTAKLDSFAQWIAPLGTLARDTLVRDLTARLPAGSVLPPGATGGPGIRTLDVTILAFAGGADGATLQVAYRTLPNGPVHQAELHVQGPADRPVDGARVLAALIGMLADRIVAELPNG